MTRLEVVLHFKSPTFKYGGHKSWGSKDIIEVGRKVGRFDGLITKCGNSIT